MQSASTNPARSGRTAAIVPSMADWRTYPHVWLNLLVFGLAALAGTWIVHQTEYLIEYGRRFPTVMAASPHHVYMQPLGAVLLLTFATLLITLTLALGLARTRLHHLLNGLPPRLRRHLRLPSPSLSPRAVLGTALVLAACQAGLYLLQENLEGLAASGAMPGLGVLLLPQHITVLPLHLLAGLCGSVFLWTASSWLDRSRRSVRMARTLASFTAHTATRPARILPERGYIPCRRMAAGALGLRSPPLTV